MLTASLALRLLAAGSPGEPTIPQLHEKLLAQGARIEELQDLGITVINGLDCTWLDGKLDFTPDLVYFNFPHAGKPDKVRPGLCKVALWAWNEPHCGAVQGSRLVLEISVSTSGTVRHFETL